MARLPDGDHLVIELSVDEAMTVAAAVQQYEPYLSPQLDAAAVVRQLAGTTEQVAAILAKLRTAAADS